MYRFNSCRSTQHRYSGSNSGRIRVRAAFDRIGKPFLALFFFWLKKRNDWPLAVAPMGAMLRLREEAIDQLSYRPRHLKTCVPLPHPVPFSVPYPHAHLWNNGHNDNIVQRPQRLQESPVHGDEVHGGDSCYCSSRLRHSVCGARPVGCARQGLRGKVKE